MKIFNSTHKQIQKWQIAASVLPLTTIFFLATVYSLGWTNIFEKAIVIAATGLFFISTFWWWWIMYKIKKIAELMDRTDYNLDSVKQEITIIRNDLKQ